MSIQNGYQYSFNQDGSSVSGVLPYNGSAGASASVTLPAGIETIMLATNTNACHFRFSNGASTAVATDPLIVFQMGPLIVKLPTSTTAYTLSALGDTASGGNLCYAKVAEA